MLSSFFRPPCQMSRPDLPPPPPRAIQAQNPFLCNVYTDVFLHNSLFLSNCLKLIKSESSTSPKFLSVFLVSFDFPFSFTFLLPFPCYLLFSLRKCLRFCSLFIFSARNYKTEPEIRICNNLFVHAT